MQSMQEAAFEPQTLLFLNALIPAPAWLSEKFLALYKIIIGPGLSTSQRKRAQVTPRITKLFNNDGHFCQNMVLNSRTSGGKITIRVQAVARKMLRIKNG